MLPLHATQPPLYQSSDSGVSQTASRLQAKVDRFLEFIEKQVTEPNMSPDHFINLDEIPPTIDIPLGRSAVV